MKRLFQPAQAFALGLITCAALACASERKLPAPEHLPASARILLAQRMIDHGNDMSDLLWATLFLDDESVVDIAEHIRSTPRLSHPISRDATEFNSVLPDEFFALQDELQLRAEELLDSAKSRDADAMATAYGALTQTCVRCHSVYLTPRVTSE